MKHKFKILNAKTFKGDGSFNCQLLEYQQNVLKYKMTNDKKSIIFQATHKDKLYILRLEWFHYENSREKGFSGEFSAAIIEDVKVKHKLIEIDTYTYKFRGHLIRISHKKEDAFRSSFSVGGELYSHINYNRQHLLIFAQDIINSYYASKDNK